MERDEAHRVFELVADLRGDLRERLVTERWWLVWAVTGVQIAITDVLTQWLIWRGETRVWAYVLLWGAQVLALPITIAVIHRRAGGQRTQREAYIWWTWVTFLVLGTLVALINTLLGLPLFMTAPMIPLLAAFGFATMAATVHRAFIVGGVLFVIVSLLMSVFRDAQFLIYGAGWFVTLEFLAVYFRPRRGGGGGAL